MSCAGSGISKLITHGKKIETAGTRLAVLEAIVGSTGFAPLPANCQSRLLRFFLPFLAASPSQLGFLEIRKGLDAGGPLPDGGPRSVCHP